MSDTEWQKSSYCGAGGNNCVEIRAVSESRIALRDSNAQIVTAGRDAFKALLDGVRSGALTRRPN